MSSLFLADNVLPIITIILQNGYFLQVQCFPIYSVLRALDCPIVDYFSLDIEGAEYQVLNTIPFQEVNIKLFGIETAHAGKIFNGTEEDITKLLSANGFQYVAKSRLDKFYRKKGKNKNNGVQKIVTVS